MAVAGRILIQVILMVFFCIIKAGKGHAFCHNRICILLLLLLDCRLNHGPVLYLHIIDAVPVLFPNVTALPVELRRIHNLEKGF